MKYIFAISTIIFFYHIFGYGLLLVFLNLFQKKKKYNEISEFPTITILCPAFNEEDVIDEKIRSFFNLDYPEEKIKMIIISDDSTDRTNQIVESYLSKGRLELIIQKPRRGKQSGHNLVEPSIISEYVLSTDANSIFKTNAVKELVKIMQSDNSIGMVSGELNLLSPTGQDSGEGLYWKYENFLKKEESKLYSIICANGSLFLLKRELFTQIDIASSDDFERTLITLKNGYKAKYTPQAVVTEDVSSHPKEEIGRKVRIISQEWFAWRRQIAVFKNPIVSFMLVSHKLIRWTFPLYSLGILLSSILLYENLYFLIFALGQIFFYLLGVLHLLILNTSKSNKLLNLVSYITAMNYSAIKAFIQFIRNKKFATWNTIRDET